LKGEEREFPRAVSITLAAIIIPPPVPARIYISDPVTAMNPPAHRKVKSFPFLDNTGDSQKNRPFRSSLREYRDLLKAFFKRPAIILFLLIFSITGFQAGLLIFNVIYLKDILKLQPDILALLPFLSSLVMLCVYLFAIPVLSKKGKDFTFLCAGGFIAVTGSLIYILAGTGGGIIIAASVMLTALGNSLSSPFKQSCFNNMMQDKDRAKVLSIQYTLIALFTIPSGVAAGFLYKLNPVYPFALSLTLLSLNFILYLLIHRLEARPFKTCMQAGS
jgi:hypothetical protein